MNERENMMREEKKEKMRWDRMKRKKVDESDQKRKKVG